MGGPDLFYLRILIISEYFQKIAHSNLKYSDAVPAVQPGDS